MIEQHYSKVTYWRWNYFTPKEIACKGSGFIVIDEYALDCLNCMRHIIGEPFSPNSAYRSEKHNKKVGGATNSYHRKGKAFDIPIKGDMTRAAIHQIGKLCGFTGIGDYDDFVHVDTGIARYWDEREEA